MASTPFIPLAALLVEDQPDDAELLLRELRRVGFDPRTRRVDSEADYLAALSAGFAPGQPWDIVLSDFQMPGFGGPRALELLLADLSPVRLEMARKWLAPRQALAAGPALEAQLAELTGGDLPSLVFDCTGSPASMMQSFRYVANGGRLVLVGLAQADITFFDPEFHRRELTLLASRNATRADLQRVSAAMAAGQVITEPLTTARVALDQLVEAFPGWLDPQAGVLKAMVELN